MTPQPICDQDDAMQQNSGQSLYDRARQLIPGGTQLLSKRPEMFLPNQWPTYYSRAKGCRVWDLDGRELIDMSMMGIGSCLLGYADDEVNAAVKKCVDDGSMTTLNAPEEVELAELLCQIHPWAGMVRYARTGGEAMAIATRIARARTGRQVVAICGYHGWADWYLAANLATDSALDGHLLPGLSPVGVPRSLGGTTIAFRYNHIEELEQIAASQGDALAAIIMEPMRYTPPSPGFLEGVRAIADRCGAILVFDEITSGWRFRLGGVHLDLGVTPDIAVFAKAISNGYPMSAVLGRTDVMQAAQDSFISSTSWTERIGPVAALATIRKMERIGLHQQLKTTGQRVIDGWGVLAETHRLRLNIQGQPALATFAFQYADQSAALKTLFTQEMLDRGFMASGSFYASAAHGEMETSKYLAACDESFRKLSIALVEGDPARHLRGPVAHSGFQRLN